MKASEEIKNLKIISMDEGQQINYVKDIIIDPDNGCLAFFITDQPSDYFGARIIAFQDIMGLGDYAIVIKDRSVIQDVARSEPAIALLQKNVRIIGAQVLTAKGGFVGQVSEFMIDEETGRIVLCKLSGEQGIERELHCDKVITYGKEIILIQEDAPQAVSNHFNEKDALRKKIEEFGKTDSLLNHAVNNEFSDSPEFNVFEQRQLQFLVGKSLNKDVLLEDGELLKAGQPISKEMLSGVKSRATLMQLTAHVIK